MTFKKSESAGYLANHMARLFARNLQAEIVPLGLTIGTFPALLELWEKDGQTQRDLVVKLDIEQPTMANTLTRMERDGLVQRKQDESDGRLQRIWLTNKARKLKVPALEAAQHVNNSALAGLSKDEHKSLVLLLQDIIGKLAEAKRE